MLSRSLRKSVMNTYNQHERTHTMREMQQGAQWCERKILQGTEKICRIQHRTDMSKEATMKLRIAKNIVILIMGIAAFILLVAEGETYRETLFIKIAACALVGSIALISKVGEEP